MTMQMTFPDSTYLIVGDIISLKTATIKALCTLTAAECLSWSFSSVQTIAVSPPLVPVQPRVSISSPSTIGPCVDLVLDLSGSTGSCGKPWRVDSFSAVSSNLNTSKVDSFLRHHYLISPPSAIPSTLLLPGSSYTFFVQLCNVFGSCGQATKTVAVINTQLPVVSILGNSVQNVYRKQALELSTSTFQPSCHGSLAAKSFSYSWTLLDSSNVVVANAISLSKDPSKFFLSEFTLLAGSSYTVVVSAMNSLTSLSSSANVLVSVSRGSLVAVLSGGFSQTLRAFQSSLLSAASSYDEDQSNGGIQGIHFGWNCHQSFPKLTSSCGITFKNISSVQNVISITAVAEIVNTSFIFTMTMFDDSRSASQTCEINVIKSSSPLVSIATIVSGPVNPDEVLTLQGSVTSFFTGYALWTINDQTIDLSALSQMPSRSLCFVSELGSSVFSSFLVIPAGVLPERTNPLFTFSFSPINSQVSVQSSVAVVINGPPLPGSFAVTPVSGVGLSTSFTSGAFNWVDVDLPITFEFGFVSPSSSSSSYLVTQSRSQAAFGSSFLPAGSVGSAYSIVCSAKIFDSLNTNTTVTSTITVHPSVMNMSTLAHFTTSQLFSSAAVDDIKQVMSAVGSTLNVVDCAVSPNCSAFHRSSCQHTSHTCGSCLTGFVGVDGDSNVPCFTVAQFVNIAANDNLDCAHDADCGDLFSCTLGKCVGQNKACTQKCFNSGGSCGYQLISSGAFLNSCQQLDSRCKPVCNCLTGSFGPDCADSLTTMTSKRAIRSTLMSALSNLTTSETSDKQVVSNWASSLVLLSQNPDEMSAESLVVSAAVTFHVLEAAQSIGISNLDVTSLYSAIDNQVLAKKLFVSSGRQLASSLVKITTDELLSRLGQQVVSAMVPLQLQQSSLQSTFRMTSSVLSSRSANHSSLVVPISHWELLTGIKPSSTTVPLSTVAASLSLNVLSTAAKVHNATSDSLQIQFNPNQACVEGRASQTFVTVLQHKQSVEFGSRNNTNKSFVTSCQVGQVKTVVYPCLFGLNVSARCNGTKAHSFVSRCPERVVVPQCVFSTALQRFPMKCHVANHSSSHTTCSCVMNCSHYLASKTSSSNRLLTTSTPSTDYFAFQVVAVASYAFEDFSSEMESAASFNSVESLEDSIIVVITFVCLWVGSFVGIAVLDFFNSRGMVFWKDLGQRNNEASLRITPSSAVASVVENHLSLYISSFFSVIFSDLPKSSRLWHELVTKHIYISILYQPDQEKRLIKVLSVLTYLTANMFLLAVFYDIQWPSDDGRCALFTASTACLQDKSLFNSANPKCEWTSSLDAASGKSGICSWKQPDFDPNTLIVISLVVVLVSGPIFVILSTLINFVLLAPTTDVLQREQAHLLSRRLAAVATTTATSGLTQPVASVVTSIDDGEDQGNEQTAKPRAFSSLTVVDSNLKSFRLQAQRSQRFVSVVKTSSLSFADNDLHNAKCGLFRDSFGVAENLWTDVNLCLGRLNSREKQRFRSQWGLDLSPEESFHIREAVSRELAEVVEESNHWIQVCRGKPLAFVGIKLLELFVQDLIGRRSRQAKIFAHEVNPFTNSVVITWGVKCMVVSLLILINGYFIYSCMLYGKSKGLDWQRGWLIASMVNLFIDIFIKQVNITVVMHYFVPDAIFETTRGVQIAVRGAMKKMLAKTKYQHPTTATRSPPASVSSSPAPDLTLSSNKSLDFSISDYLFVSCHVARAFPQLMESGLVLSHRTNTVSHAQSDRWKQSTAAGGGVANDISFWDRMSASSLLSSLSVFITSLLVMFGSQDPQLQNLIINTLNPLFVAVVAFMGVSILNSSIVGVPVGFAVIVGGVGLTMWLFKRVENWRVSPSPSSLDPTTRDDTAQIIEIKELQVHVNGHCHDIDEENENVVEGNDVDGEAGDSPLQVFSQSFEGGGDEENENGSLHIGTFEVPLSFLVDDVTVSDDFITEDDMDDEDLESMESVGRSLKQGSGSKMDSESSVIFSVVRKPSSKSEIQGHGNVFSSFRNHSFVEISEDDDIQDDGIFSDESDVDISGFDNSCVNKDMTRNSEIAECGESNIDQEMNIDADGDEDNVGKLDMLPLLISRRIIVEDCSSSDISSEISSMDISSDNDKL